ncbi:regulator of G-protein signaling 16 [Sorex fumeus]|uniref:regulator of G-protein signaling 16 n=1 Tax=Sorex fumeus TaxID=62283 RepID=UPI0024AE458F|nr:regulator of G-protein signaling 16 [Sorex fumeus]
MCRTLSGFPTTCLERAKELKTRLGTLLQKPDPGRLPGSRKRSKEGNCSNALRWRESFDALLSDPSGVAAFHAFLKTEFSQENLEFWLACEGFKKIQCRAKREAQAHCIFQEFVSCEAPKEVNLDHETRELTRAGLQATPGTCFDVAQAKTRVLMEKDSYPRFLRSPAYQDLAARACPPPPSQS